MPTSVRVAVIVMSFLAGILLLVAAMNLYILDELTARVADAQNTTEADAQRGILLLLGPYLVLGLIFALSAWFLPRRHAWARWLGLAASSVIAMLLVLTAIAGGGITVMSLLLFVLALAAISSLVSRTTSAWMPRLRSRG
jgi:hypothetical protein